jgi:hypothetical protein
MATFKKFKTRFLILRMIALAFAASHLLLLPPDFPAQPQAVYAQGPGGGAGVGGGAGAGCGAAGASGVAASGAAAQGAATSEAATSPDTTGLGKAEAVVGTTPAAESAATGLATAIESNREEEY